MDLGLSTTKALVSTPATSILRNTDGSHWSSQDHVFGEVTAVGMSEAKSNDDYNYKTEFKI